ncbi:hypothetical protein DPMN_086336 [Dreissena polymorpha]|uniref:Major facilitator superfamily (MFS) profile domain-containing protein n=1 Tax=Dreissena polymorpha TaxID=45954 RepID=A0A9D4KQ90_DREPO|nr:hypothetical protein DPMN_086336 [Dreissena polymorpha]
MLINHMCLRTEIQNGSSVHRWLVFMSSYLVVVINIGFAFSVGSLFVIIIRRFNTTRAEAATIQSTLGGVLLCSGIFFGALIHKTSVRAVSLFGSLMVFVGFVSSAFVTSPSVLIVTLGVIVGLGMSPLLISSVSVTAKHFDGHGQLLVILSVLSTGSATGGSIYPFIIPWLDDLYGYPGIFLICGAVSSNTFALVTLWAPVEQPSVKTKQTATTGHHKEINRINVSVVTVPDIRLACDNSKFKIDDIASDQADNQTRTEPSSNAGVNGTMQTVDSLDNNILTGPKSTDLTLRSSMHCLFRNKVFMVFVAGLAFALPIINIFTAFIVDLYQDRGSTNKEASFGLIALNLCGGLGRLSPGFIMKIPGMTTLGVPIIACVLLGIGIVCAVFVPGISLLILSSCVIGFAIGILVASINVTTASLVGTKHLGNAIGIICTMHGIGTAISGHVAGYVRDVTSGYKLPLLAAFGTVCVALAFMCISNKLQAKISRGETLSGETINVPV